MMSKFISNLFGTLGCAAVLYVILCMGYLASIISVNLDIKSKIDEMVKECEANLPRTQHCGYEIVVKPIEEEL